MEILTWILIAGVAGLAGYQGHSLSKLRRQTADTTSLLSDLEFKQKDSTEFLGTQAARIHYDLLKRSKRLVFYPEMPLQQALNQPGARELLIRRKMIRKKDEGPFEETLTQRARNSELSLEPILIALNDLKTQL